METEVDNQEPTTETILHKTASESEPDKHRETVLKHYKAENVKDHIEGDNIETVGEKLLSSPSELNTTVEIRDNTEVSESLDRKETEDKISKRLGVKETEGERPKSSDETKTEDHHIEKRELNSLQEIQLITKKTVGEGYSEHNLGAVQEAEVYGSELTQENKVEDLSNASITLDGTEKITSIDPVTIEDHISRTSPEEDLRHRFSSGTAEKELDIASASEDVRSNLEEMECRGDMMEEITNTEKIGCDVPVNVTLQSDYLSEPEKEAAEAVESSSGIKEIALLEGLSDKVEKARNAEINLPESPKEAKKDEIIDASSTEEKPPFDAKNVSAADLNEEGEIPLYDTAKGQQNAPPVVHETEALEGAQLSVEKPKVMHDMDEADRKLDSSDLGMPLTEGASDMDVAPPCQIDVDNLEAELNMGSREELEITGTKTEDFLVESHNLSIGNDDNSKVTKQEEEFDSASATLSDQKIDKLNVQENEHKLYPQMEGKSEATGLRDGKESDTNANINQNSKPEEHQESDTLDEEAEEIYSAVTDKEHTTQSYSTTLITSEESKETVNKASKTEDIEQISASSEGKEIQGQVIEGSVGTETEGHASESSEGKETEFCDTKSSGGKETQNHHAEKGEWKSSPEIQTITEEIIGEMYKGPNGGISPEGCGTTEVLDSLDGKETEGQVSMSLGVKETEGQLPKNSDERKIEDLNSSQAIELITEETVGEGYRENNGGTAPEAEVHGSELTEENKGENLYKASITLDGTETLTSVEPVTFKDHISPPSPEEEPCHTISSDTAAKELHMSSASEDVQSKLEEMGGRGDMEETTNNEKIVFDSPVNMTHQSNYLSEPNKNEAKNGAEMNACVGRALAVTPIEETRMTSLRSEAVESRSNIKEISSDGQSEKVEKARNTIINLPESPREARKDETIDASSTKEKPTFDEKNVSAANLNEEDEIHLYDADKGQQNPPPLVHETEASGGTQLSVEESKVMHDIDEANRKLNSSDLVLPPSEGASDMDLAPSCQVDADNLGTESSMDSKKESGILETKTEDSHVESHNLSITNDDNRNVTKEEEEFDSASATLSDEKIDELNVQESEHKKYPQMEGKSEATGLRDGKKSDMNDNINQTSKPEEHGETGTLDTEAEEIYSDITDKEHTTQSYSATLTTEESKEAVDKTTEIEDTEQISESLEGKVIQGQVLEGSGGKETEGDASESSEGKETEGYDTKSSDGKDTQDHHAEKGEWKSTPEIRTITEEMIGEMYKGPNGGIAPEGTDIDIPASNSHQSEEVEQSELTGENNVENMTKAVTLDNTEKNTGVEPVTFVDHLHRPSVEENSSHAISSSMDKRELYVPSASEDLAVNLADVESRAMEVEIINHEKVDHGTPANVTLESNHLSITNEEDMEKGEEMNSFLGSASSVMPIEETCVTSSSEDVSSFGVKGISLQDEQAEVEEKARDTEINLPEVPTETREDEIIDASSTQENQPIDAKNILVDAINEEDGSNQHDTTKRQPDVLPLVHETEVCEENQVSPEEPAETHDVDEVDRMSHSSTLELTPTEVDAAATKIDSTKELQIIAESKTKDKSEENDDADRDSIKAETNFDSSSTIPTAKITNELNIQETEYREDSRMEDKSEAKGDLGDGKESDSNNDNNQNSELQGHGETDRFMDDEGIPIITNIEQSSQIYPRTQATEDLKVRQENIGELINKRKTNEEAAKECENTFNSPNKDEGTEDEASVSIREKDLLDSLATPEEVIEASNEEDKENLSQIKEEHFDQATESTKFSEDKANIEDLYGEDKEGKEEKVVVSQVASTSDEAETNELDSLNNLLPTSIVEKVEENQEIIQENVDSMNPEEIVILGEESKEQNSDATHHIEDTKEKLIAASSMHSLTGIVESDMPREEHNSIEENPSSLPDEPKSKEEFSSTSQSVVAEITREMGKDSCKENKMNDRDEEPDSIILKESASEPTLSEPDEASKTDEYSKELSSISESDVKEHCDRTYMAEQASRTDESCEELPTISREDIEKQTDSSILETRVTHENVKRVENQGTKSVEDQIDQMPCEYVEEMHVNFTNESSQVPEEIEKNDHIIETPEETKEEGTFKELHSASEPDTSSHNVKDIGLASLQSIDTIDSNDKAEERPVLPAENPKSEEESSMIEAPEEMKEGKEQVQDMKSVSLQNIEKKDPDEKPEESVIQLAEDSNTEQEPSPKQVAQETTGDKEHVQHISNISLQNIDKMDLDEKSEERDIQPVENSITDQESSTTEVLKETIEEKESIQDETIITTEEVEKTSSHNFIKEVDDCNDKADALVKKESSLENVDIDEKTFQVYSTDMDNENPSRINSSSKKDEQVEIKQPEMTGGSVYQTEPSETKEIISEVGTEMESKYIIDALSESIETPNEQDDNTDKSQQNREGKEEIYGMIHGNNDDVKVGHITSIQKEEEEEEATNELQEMCFVQPMEEKGGETLDAIKETIHEDGIVVGVSSVISSEEECLLNNNSNTLESRLLSVEGTHDRSTMEEENIYKENSEETGAKMSSADHNCLTSDNSMKDVDNGTVMIEELQESKEATDLKSDMSPVVLKSETKLYHAEVPSPTQTGTINEETLQAELGVENTSKEETITGSTEDNISREKIKDEGSSDLERDSVTEEPQSITIEEMSETTKKENNNQKVPDYDIDITQSEKDRRDDEYEKSLKSNSQSGERSIADDFPVTDIPGSDKAGETTELLAEGHTSAEGSSLDTSEEIKRRIIYEDTNEKNEDQVTFEANTSDVMVNEVIKQQIAPDEDHSKIPDPCLEKSKNDCIDTEEVQILRDIEMMPESVNKTAQTETLKQQTTDDSNDVPEATNSDPELKCTSDESKTIGQEATTIRLVNDPTLDLIQGPTDNNLSAADKEEGLAQISEVLDDHVITDEAEKEDPLEHEKRSNTKIEIQNSGNLTVSSDKVIEEREPEESKPMLSSKGKDIPLLESVSTTVTDMEEVKQVYPCEAVTEPNSTVSAEKEASYDQEETADSPERETDLAHGFAEEKIHEPGDTDSQDQHDNHVVQHVQRSFMGSQEDSIDDVQSTHQTAELTPATLLKSESHSTPEVDRIIVSSPNESKDDAQMQEKIAAEDIKVRKETLECAESNFKESKGEANQTMDEPEETTEKLLPAELSGERTSEEGDHPGEKSMLKTQPAAREVKPEDAKVENEEHTEQKEGNSGSVVIFNGAKGPDDNTNKIIEGEVDISSTIYSNELLSVQVDPEERTEILINREGIAQITDETKAEREDQEVSKGKETGSEPLPMSEKDADGHNIDRSIVAETKDGTSRATPDDRTLVQGSPEDQDQDEVVKEEQEVPKENNPGAETPVTDEKGPDYYTSSRITMIEMKDESPSAEPDYRTSVQEDPGDSTKTMIFSGDEEVKADVVEVEIGDRDVQKEELGTEVAVLGKTDCEDNRVSVEGNTEDLREESVTHREEKGIDPYSKSGVTEAEIEKLISVNTSEAVAESERLESAEEKISSHDYQEKQEALESSLSSKISQTNQGQDFPEEKKLNAVKIEPPTPESLHALPYITGLSTETIAKADDSDIDISLKNEEKQEIPPLAAEKFMVVEADLKVNEEPENAKNNLQLLPKEDADIFQANEKNSGRAELDSIPANSNNEKTSRNETREGNNLASEKETEVVEQFSTGHFSEAKVEEEEAKNTGRKKYSKAVRNPEDKDQEDEEAREQEEENTGSGLRVRTEASRDTEVKVSPKKSHNLFSGVIKHSISKMKKAITCTNSHPMPQSPK